MQIDVRVEVIDRDGLDALNLRALAARAGVSPGAPYHHFADRAELLAAIALEEFERLEQAMIDRRDAAPPDPVSRLDAIGQAYLGFAVSNTGHVRVMFRDNSPAARNAALSAASQKAYRLLFDVVEACRRVAAAPTGDPGTLV